MTPGPNTVRVETRGSHWWFDEDMKVYMRLPVEEQPRERPEWSDERAGALQDGVWHQYAWFTIGSGRLWIFNDDGKWIASAPMPAEPYAMPDLDE